MRERLRAVAAREGGISLIEMLVAILILGVALAAFAGSMISSVRAVAQDQRLIVANALATEVVEEIQGLRWDDAAFFEDEAVAQLGGTTFEGEDLVLMDDTRTAGSSVPLPVETIVRDGYEYTVTRAITWVDDDADGLGGADSTGDTQDYKRITVTLEWSVGGTSRDLRVSALRSAETRERPLRVEATDFVDLDTDACNTSGDHGDGNIVLTAVTIDPAQYVEATFRKRDGSTVTVDLVHAGDYENWSRTISTSCPHPEGGPFADGPVLFTFEAQDRADASLIYEATELVVFVRPVGIRTVTVSEVDVDGDGNSVCDVTIDVEVSGGTPDDTVTATWDTGPDPVDLGFVTLKPFGATFTHTYGAGTEFGDPGTRTVTVNVDRQYDAAIDEGTATVTVEAETGGVDGCSP